MKRAVRISQRAESDLEELFLYYLVEGGEAPATRFLDAFDEARVLLANYPEIGGAREWTDPRLRAVRVLPVNEPFRSILVLYRIEAASVCILRVLHGARELEDLLVDESAE